MSTAIENDGINDSSPQLLLDALSDTDDLVATDELLSFIADCDSAADNEKPCAAALAAPVTTTTTTMPTSATATTTVDAALDPKLHRMADAPQLECAQDSHTMSLREIDATLAIIDCDVVAAELDNTTDDSTPLEHSAATTTSALPNPRAAAGKTTHKRTKDELQYLRQQVHDLEQRLASLRPSASADTATPASASPLRFDHHSDSPGAGSAQSALWERIATRQRSAKHRAETENQQLRHALESQLKIAQGLSRLLRKRPNLSWLDDSESTLKRLRPVETDDALVFAQLERQAATLVDRVDSVLQSAGLSDITSHHQDGAIKCDAFGRAFLEVVDCNVLPFDVATVSAAVWTLLSGPQVTVTNGVYQALESTDSVVRAQFRVTVRLRRSEAMLHVRGVGQRIVQASRVVIVWCSEGESEGSLLGGERIVLRESGWAAIEPYCTSRPSSSSGDAVTTMKSVMHVAPSFTTTDSYSSSSSSEGERAQRVETFIDVVMGSFRENYALMHERIEDLALSSAQQQNLNQ